MMDTFSDYEAFDGLGLANLVQTRVVSPVELLNAAIARIEQRNPALNAVIYTMYDEALQTIKKGLPQGPFQGVPFLLKDLLADMCGTPLCYGSRFAQGNISKVDAELVNRFKNAGLVIVGKTNLPEFGLSFTTEPKMYGPTRNPWDLTRSPGGSSGGSAAAVAAGMVPMAHGGDGAGSLRTPASFCGLFALKPTRGRTPSGPLVMRNLQGMVVENVITRSVRDSAAMLDCLAGPEPGSIYFVPANAQNKEASFLSSLETPLLPLRIALLNPSEKINLCPDNQQALQKAAKLCENLGHLVEPVSLTMVDEETTVAYLIVMCGETAAMLNLLANALNKKDFNEVEAATALLRKAGNSFSAADFSWAIAHLDKKGNVNEAFFQKYDVLLTPTMPNPPPLLGTLGPTVSELRFLEFMRYVPSGTWIKKLIRQFSQRFFAFSPYTSLFNITGQPAMSVPLYWDSQGLPIGIQFASGRGNERTLLQLAAQLEIALPWWNTRPDVL